MRPTLTFFSIPTISMVWSGRIVKGWSKLDELIRILSSPIASRTRVIFSPARKHEGTACASPRSCSKPKPVGPTTSRSRRSAIDHFVAARASAGRTGRRRSGHGPVCSARSRACSFDLASKPDGPLFVVADAATLVADARNKGFLGNGLGRSGLREAIVHCRNASFRRALHRVVDSLS
jgi:hypothetical protein